MITGFDYIANEMAKNTPSMSFEGELSLWQKRAREKLKELLGLPRFEQVEPEVKTEYIEQLDDAQEIRFTFQSEAGYRVPCHLWIPKGIKQPKVMICLQGHSSGMHISLGRSKCPKDQESISGGDRDFCVRAVKEGYAAVALEQRHFGESSGKDHCHTPTLANLLIGRTTIGERVWDVMRLIDVLESEFSHLINTDRIALMGNSGGGTTTVYAAALEDRIKLAMPSCSMCTFADSIGAMKHCVCNYVPHIAEYFDMGDLMAMSCPKFFVQVSGKTDGIFPFEAARQEFERGRSGYASVGLEYRCEFVAGEGGHRFYADAAWPVVHRLMEDAR